MSFVLTSDLCLGLTMLSYFINPCWLLAGWNHFLGSKGSNFSFPWHFILIREKFKGRGGGSCETRKILKLKDKFGLHFVCLFWDKVSFCNLGCLGTHYKVHAGLEHSVILCLSQKGMCYYYTVSIPLIFKSQNRHHGFNALSVFQNHQGVSPLPGWHPCQLCHGETVLSSGTEEVTLLSRTKEVMVLQHSTLCTCTWGALVVVLEPSFY